MQASKDPSATGRLPLMPGPQIALTATPLFGNDAAEDEDEDIFLAYVVERPEVTAFLDASQKICIVRAFKGEGKSALLRLVQSRLGRAADAPLILAVTGKQLSPTLTATDTDAWVRDWKRSMLHHIARELGARVGTAWSDDAISLVEEAEQAGFKSRNFISAIFDRLKTSALPLKRDRLPVGNSEKLVQRWAGRTDGIWLFVDDVDENFKNDPRHKLKVASFFIAVRELVNAIPQIRVRAAVRPNTWTTLALEFEALSKVEQYNVDLRWTERELSDVLGARVRGYLIRTNQWETLTKSNAGRQPSADDLIALVFQSPVEWGGKQRAVRVPLVTLSRRRPRWLIELAREAAKAAHDARRHKVHLEDITGCLEAFGNKRIADTVAEFSAQCAQINELIAAFSRQAEEYATAELISTIEKRVLQATTPTIVGIMGAPRPVEVAAFLFQIGFLSARRNLGGDEYEHMTYVEKPDLLRARTNLDDGLRWEIHPVFRQALQMRDAFGRSLRVVPADRRGR
jgi:hypothetical protein